MPTLEARIVSGLKLPAFVGPLAMGLGFLIVVALAASTLWLIEQNRVSQAWVSHSLEVQRGLATLRADLNAAESARRGLLLAPSETLQTRYAEMSARVPRDVENLRALTADNPRQAARLARFEEALAPHVRAQEASVIGVGIGARAPAMQTFARDGSATRILGLEAILDEMTAHESTLLRARIARDETNLRRLFFTTVAGVAVIALLGLLSIAAYARDAAALQRSRAELNALNMDLEETVAERTVALEQATAEIQRFAHLVSHDLRAPLVNVMGFTNELRRVRADLDADPQPPTMREDMDEAIHFIQASTQKMDRLINSILRMAREGRRTLTPQSIDLEELVNAQIDSVRHAAQQRQIEIAVEGEMPVIVSDRLALEQVLGNLIDNAVKYAKPDVPGRVTIRGRQAGGFVELSVEDTGIGVAEKDQQRIFDMFRRGAGADSEQGEGVGLAYARHIVRRLGGVMILQSRLGEGATFIVRLPKRLVVRERVNE
ncbi:MAG: ATP-binding protein [Hyphomonadaceae bacterium]